MMAIVITFYLPSDESGRKQKQTQIIYLISTLNGFIRLASFSSIHIISPSSCSFSSQTTFISSTFRDFQFYCIRRIYGNKYGHSTYFPSDFILPDLFRHQMFNCFTIVALISLAGVQSIQFIAEVHIITLAFKPNVNNQNDWPSKNETHIMHRITVQARFIKCIPHLANMLRISIETVN